LLLLFCLGTWEGGGSGNAAHVLVIASEPEVALLSPAGSPGILDDPVVSAG